MWLVGSLLMVSGALLSVVSTFLTWNHDQTYGQADDGYGIQLVEGEAWNGWQQAAVNVSSGRIYGLLMYLSLGLACTAAVIVLLASIAIFVTKCHLGPPQALTGAIIGFVATIALVGGYVVLGAAGAMEFGVWLFGSSFIGPLVGAILVLRARPKPAPAPLG